MTMKKVMSDEDLNRALEPKIEEDRVRKAQEKARNQINYERYLEREQKLYEHEYKKMKRSARAASAAFFPSLANLLFKSYLL